MSHWTSGDLEAADRVFADYTLRLKNDGNIPDAISTAVVLADIRLALGRLHDAVAGVEQLLQLVMEQGDLIPLDTADLYRELSELYLEQGNLEAAAQHLKRSMELGEKAELVIGRYRFCIAQARLYKTQADLEGALAFLDEAERLYVRSPFPDFCPSSAIKARIWVLQGNLIKALEWAHQRGLSSNDDISYLREFEHITHARILIAQYLNDRKDFSIQAVQSRTRRMAIWHWPSHL
jgi:LuxR family transcriptional regulator, maltose regulon positive regulatory protein